MNYFKLLPEKKYGRVKSRTCDNGSIQRAWTDQEYVNSKSLFVNSVLLTSVINKKIRKILRNIDIPNEFVQAEVNTIPGQE